MSKVNPLLQISTEGMYDYKNPLVQKNIIEAIEGFRTTQDANAFTDRLESLAKITYGINLTVCLTEQRVPAMIVHEQVSPESLPRFRPRSISDSENLKGNGLREFNKICSGWINASTLKVGGIFADLPVTVLLANNVTNWSNETFGVAFLHELGHYLDYVLMATNQFRSFGAVESMVRGIRGAESVEQSVEFIRTVSGEYGFKVTDPDQLKLASTDEAIRLKLFKDIQVSNPAFLYGDQTKAQQEYIADELPAAVFGPRVAASSLSKLLAMSSHPAYRPTLWFYGRTSVAIALLMFGAASAMLPVAAIGALAVLADQAEATMGNTHPSPLSRLQRFRGLLLSDAKNPEMTREQVTQLDNDLTLINAEISRLNSANKSGLTLLIDLFNPSVRAAKSIDEWDNAVAELQNNPLFLRAAQLRQL